MRDWQSELQTVQMNGGKETPGPATVVVDDKVGPLSSVLSRFHLLVHLLIALALLLIYHVCVHA